MTFVLAAAVSFATGTSWGTMAILMPLVYALGAELPVFAHLPMILAEDGVKLSKRVHGEAVSVIQYRKDGYLPEALLNYLVRLGWSHGDREIFSVDEMVEFFDLENVNKSASSFNPEKLLWLNQHYIKASDPMHIARHLSHHLGLMGIDPAQPPDLHDVAKVQLERAQTLVEMADISQFFYQDFDEFDEQSAKKHLRPVAREALEKVRQGLAALDSWTPETTYQVVQDIAAELDLKMGKVAQPLRVAIVGRAASPSIDVTLHLVGQTATLRRIDKALAYIEQREQAQG